MTTVLMSTFRDEFILPENGFDVRCQSLVS